MHILLLVQCQITLSLKQISLTKWNLTFFQIPIHMGKSRRDQYSPTKTTGNIGNAGGYRARRKFFKISKQHSFDSNANVRIKLQIAMSCNFSESKSNRHFRHPKLIPVKVHPSRPPIKASSSKSKSIVILYKTNFLHQVDVCLRKKKTVICYNSLKVLFENVSVSSFLMTYLGENQQNLCSFWAIIKGWVWKFMKVLYFHKPLLYILMVQICL